MKMDPARILIVEDDAILAAHLEQTLIQLGYQVTDMAATGKSAVKKAGEQEPDAILMDIRLRGEMNGIQAAEEIHKLINIPVVYLTAYTDEMLLQQAKLTSAYAYLAKPVRDHELHASLEMALYKHKTELRLEHLNRVLGAVRDVNKLITRERDPQRLMREACNILVHTRDYKFVWIGQPENHRLKPVVSVGEGEDFVELVYSTASPEQAEGLPGMEAMRTKQPVICHDLSNDARYAPWRDEILRRNLFSRAAIPMMNGDRFFGILSVYSERTAVFDEEETGLLLEMASDLAFGLNSIEEELERRQTEEKLRESEQRFRAVLNSAPITIFATDEKGVFTLNEGMGLQRVGMKPGENVGASAFDLFSSLSILEPDGHAATGNDVIHRVLGGETVTGITGLKDVSFDNRFVPILGPQGQVVGLVGVATDITERKQAEEARLESEKLYRLISENSADVIWVIDPATGKFKYVSPSVYQLRGFTPDEVMAHTLQDALTPESYNFISRKMRERISSFLEGDKSALIDTSEIDQPRKDGSIVPTEAVTTFITDEHGQLVEFLGVSRDITDRRKAREALLASEARFRSLFENAPVGVLLADPQGNILEVNPAFLQILGSPSVEATRGINILNFQPLIESGITADFQECIRTTQPLLSEHPYSTKWGKTITLTMRFTPLVEADQRTMLVQILAEDITDRKQAENALRESELRFRTLIEQAPVAISVSRDGIGLYANQKFLQLAGLSSVEESIGRPIIEYFAPQSREESKERSLRRSAGQPVPGEFETILMHKDGLQFPVQVAVSQIVLTDGLANIAFVTDISERKVAEKRIKRQLEQLTALNEIDRMITSSFDLHLSLTSIVDRVISQQKIDAADILLMNPDLNILEYSAGRGFHTLGVEKGHLSLGEGYAGRAALERQTIHIADLRAQVDNSALQKALASDNFVSYYAVPLIAKGKVKGVLEIFHRSPLDPDFEWLDFLNTLAGQAAIAIDNATLFGNLQRSNTELALAYDATIEGWSRALDLRDKETEGHTLRVTEMVLSLAGNFNIRDSEMVQIRWGALLHDIGKMGLPDNILLKPDALTEQEWEAMRNHPVIAYKLLSPIGFLRSALDIPYCHHEKWDGTGYPRGLKGGQIPLSARIFAVVDVWDALTSDRVYRKAWSNEKALDHIRSQSGLHFDPQVVEIFIQSGVLDGKKHI